MNQNIQINTSSPSTQKSPSNQTAEWAKYYQKRQWCPVPIPAGGKRPLIRDWPNFVLTDNFPWTETGVGIILGERSNGLVDIDLDCLEAVKAAPGFLPRTQYIFGRKSKPHSHYLYRVKNLDGRHPKKFNDPEDNDTLVEFRFSYKKDGKISGQQTVFPPSIHPSGELIDWSNRNALTAEKPPEITHDELFRAVTHLAVASLIGKRWKNGSRHEITLALSGFWARAEIERQSAINLIKGICLAADDPDVEDRLRAVHDSYDNLGCGEPTTGIPRLEELLGNKTVTKIQELLNIWNKPGDGLNTVIIPEKPRPLIRLLPPSELYPVDSLGDHLSDVVKAISEIVQVPAALAAGSVLATASLSVQSFANIELPINQGIDKPLSLFLVTVAQSSDRKSTADELALQPIHQYEKELAGIYISEELEFKRKTEAYSTIKNDILKKSRKESKENHSSTVSELSNELSELGNPPEPPLIPHLIIQEPTFESLLKLFKLGRPSLGLFSAEGAQMLGGYSMRDERKAVTSAGLNALWDGQPLKRTRVTDGYYSLDGRRLSLHLMIQPGVAAKLLNDRELEDIGLLSRLLISAPESLAGSRLYREAPRWASETISQFNSVVTEILSKPFPVLEGSQNILNPRSLKMSPESKQIWIDFHDEIEKQMGIGERFEGIKGFAGKLPEHAARIAGILTLIDDLNATEVLGSFMESGCRLARYYASEALRLHQSGFLSSELLEAQKLLDWLHKPPKKTSITLPDIYQFGPTFVRDKTTAGRLTRILEEHNWIRRLSEGIDENGTKRKDAWTIIHQSKAENIELLSC